MQLDDVLRYLGGLGRYQTVFIVFIGVVGTWFPAWQMTGMVFTMDKPMGYQCKNYEGPDGSSVAWSANETVETKQCFQNETENGTTTEEACSEWDYQMQHAKKTIVTDFNLVCEDAVLVKRAQSVFFFGVMFGSVVVGPLSDFLGRKMVLTAACLLEGIFGVCIAFAWNYASLVAMWFFIGVFEQGLNITFYVLIAEMLPPERRIIAGCITGVFWGLGILTLVPIAYLLRDWRHLQIAVSVPCLLAVPLLMWLASESIRWLISKNRFSQAEKELHRIAKVNNIVAPDRFLVKEDIAAVPMLADKFGDNESDSTVVKDPAITKVTNNGKDSTVEQRHQPSSQRFHVTDLLKSPLTIRNCLIMGFSWFANSMSYYGMFLYSSELAGDKYINFFLLGLVEIPAYILVYFMMERWGRRSSLGSSHFVGGVCCIISACIPAETASGVDMSPAILAFAMIGKFGVTISFSVDLYYAVEIFPTVIRNAGVGLCSFSARIGGIVAPFVVHLADVSPYLPLNVFGVFSLIAAALVVFLPETRNKTLPESLPDSEKLARSAQLPKCIC